jgi:hypothetical protein
VSRERAEFLAWLLASGTPLERESIAELVKHALDTTAEQPDVDVQPERDVQMEGGHA